MKGLPGGCSSVGRGQHIQKQVWNTGQVAGSLLWKYQIDSRGQVWEKKSGTGSSHPGFECQARSLNFILWAGSAKEGFQQGTVSECRG